MSCGKVPTRRQVHGKKATHVVKKHAKKIAVHTPVPVITAGRGMHVPPRGGYLPKPKQKVSRNPKKVAKKYTAAQNRRYQAWIKAHPFKKESAAQYRAWIKAHPFKYGGHTRKTAVTHKVACHIKTRHGVIRQPVVKPGRRPRVPQPIVQPGRRPARAARAQRAVKSLRAR